MPAPHFTDEQRDLWRVVLRSLPDGLLSEADSAIVERMAFAWATCREAQRVINRDGLLVENEHGKQIRNPVWAVLRQATAEMHACGEAIGLSPVARTRITAVDQSDDDPIALLLDGAYHARASMKMNQVE